MTFQLAAGVDVLHVDPKSGKMPGDQDGAMAFERFLFCAHQRYPKVLAHAVLDAFKATLKQFCSAQPIILDFAVFVAGRIVAPCAELRAKKKIFNAVRRQGLLQFLAVELWVNAAVGFGAHVTKRGDPMQGEQADEALLLMGRMADCKNGFLH